MTKSVQNNTYLTISVPAGFTVTVSADANSSGYVYRESDSTLLGAVQEGGSLEIGPYSNTRGFLIVPTIGELTYGDPVLSIGGGGGAGGTLEVSSIVPSGVVVADDAGEGLRGSGVLTIDEEGTVNIVSPAGITLSAQTESGIVLDAAGEGMAGLTIDASGTDNSGISVNCDNTTFIVTALGAGGGMFFDSGENDLELSAKVGNLVLGAYNGGKVKILGLPTSDPGVSGALWNSAGTLKISAG